jgi:hypothetical protein
VAEITDGDREGMRNITDAGLSVVHRHGSPAAVRERERERGASKLGGAR